MKIKLLNYLIIILKLLVKKREQIKLRNPKSTIILFLQLQVIPKEIK